MKAVLDTSQEPSAQSGAKETSKVRMVVGITSAQTCLVLTGRLKALRMAGFRVTLVSSPGELLTLTADAEGVCAKPISMQRGIDLISDFRSLLAITLFLLRERPALVDFSTPKAGLLGSVAAFLARVPHRVYTLRGLKLESTSGFKRSVLLWSERIAAFCAHEVLCNSTSLMREALALRIAPRAKLFVLGDGSSNGVNTDRFAPGRSYVRDRLKIPKGDPVLGFVGRLTVDKGIPELLTAFDEILAHHPNCWLVLVGWFDRAEDALGARWRRHIEEHPRIRKTDFVANPEDYYRAMDVLILPTHREGFPNVVLEAAACGLPVITTETTGARDAVIPEVTGLLIPPGYPEAIVAAARSLLDDEQGCIRMGRAARKWVLERFSDERVLSLAVRFYTSRLTPEEAVDLGPFAEESA